MAKILDYLRLLRLPTVFTAMADIVLGFLLTRESLQPLLYFGMLLLASSCLYLSGMIFNDVFDWQIDLQQRPTRPIPSGRISVSSAVWLGLLLVLAGLGAANIVGPNSLTVAGVLVLAIFAYNGFFKKTSMGPVAMGGCRFLNVMLGASGLANLASIWQLPQIYVATGLGIYITGVTLFARHEAKCSNHSHLLSAAGVINLGLAILITSIIHWPDGDQVLVLLLLGIIILTINRRLIAAYFDPVPEKVQPAVKMLLLSLILLDATIVLLKTGNLVYAMVTATLLIPAYVLGRWIPLT